MVFSTVEPCKHPCCRQLVVNHWSALTASMDSTMPRQTDGQCWKRIPGETLLFNCCWRLGPTQIWPVDVPVLHGSKPRHTNGWWQPRAGIHQWMVRTPSRNTPMDGENLSTEPSCSVMYRYQHQLPVKAWRTRQSWSLSALDLAPRSTKWSPWSAEMSR